MRPARFVFGSLGAVLVALVLVWPFVSGRWRGPLETETVVAADHGVSPSSSTTSPPTAEIDVAAAGRFGGEVLQGFEFAFSERAGAHVDVHALTSELDVWRLATEENRIDADVIEVGFRSDALSGGAADAFLSLDPAMVPSLSLIPREFRIAGDRGVVVGFSGLVGLAIDETASPSRSWADLDAGASELLAVPAPRSVLAPVVVLGIGGGDIDVGLDRYAGWLESGATTAVSVEDYVEAFRRGATAAVWTSSGMWRAEGRVGGVVFVPPAEGAIALPAFSGVLATTDEPDLAMRWIEFRLSEDLQRHMASIAEQGSFGQADLPALSPVIPGLDDMPTDSSAFFRLDAYPGRIVNIDWSAYDAARAAIDARFPEGEG